MPQLVGTESMDTYMKAFDIRWDSFDAVAVGYMEQYLPDERNISFFQIYNSVYVDMTGYHDKSFREFTIDDIGPLMAVKWGTSTGIEYEFIAISDYLEVIVVDALFYLQEA